MGGWRPRERHEGTGRSHHTTRMFVHARSAAGAWMQGLCQGPHATRETDPPPLLSSELSWLAAAFTRQAPVAFEPLDRKAGRALGISFSSSSYPSMTRSNRAYRLATHAWLGPGQFSVESSSACICKPGPMPFDG
uniref:Uncharacterized protein n=1 Tax=Oryza meridionalis TaxID=40149 RepID=A0A0E0CAH3_9ORYZ